MDWLSLNSADLLILDLMLPGVDGVTLCQTIRKQSNVPIIMATAKVEEGDRLRGLEIGADDYVCKPYSHREMVARVKVILRRAIPTTDPIREETSSTPFKVNQEKMAISVRGHTLDLTPVEFRLLSHLLNRPGVIYSRNDLLDILYDDYRLVSDRTVDSHIKNVRKKLQSHIPEQEVIRSVYGRGYKYELES